MTGVRGLAGRWMLVGLCVLLLAAGRCTFEEEDPSTLRVINDTAVAVEVWAFPPGQRDAAERVTVVQAGETYRDDVMTPPGEQGSCLPSEEGFEVRAVDGTVLARVPSGQCRAIVLTIIPDMLPSPGLAP